MLDKPLLKLAVLGWIRSGAHEDDSVWVTFMIVRCTQDKGKSDAGNEGPQPAEGGEEDVELAHGDSVKTFHREGAKASRRAQRNSETRRQRLLIILPIFLPLRFLAS
jgi:hypothetical protein